MFGSIGGSEFLLIAVLALLLFGPRKLPQIGRSIGRALAEFRGATNEFKSSLEREVELETLRDAKQGLEATGREIADSVKGTTRPTVARAPLDTAAGAGDGAGTRPADSCDGKKPTH